MKKIYIVAIVILAVPIGVIFASLKNTTTYSDFAEAGAAHSVLGRAWQ